MSTETGTGVKRRDFLKILGATGATTVVAGCSSERVEKLIPYVTSPDNTVPGVSQYYATTCRECATACGVMAEVRDGRPIKLEGNPDHPLNRGAICATGLSAVQGLYNPDRYRSPMIREGGALKPTTWAKAYETLAAKIGEVKSKGQAGNVLFINQHESGTFPGFLDQWLAANGMPAHLSVDPMVQSATIAANQKAYGAAWPALDFGAAKLVISFGADFLDTWGHAVPQQLDWADARAKLEGAPQLVYIGARRSLTGLNADQWIATKPGSEMALCAALVGQGTVAAASEASGVPAATIEALSAAIAAAGSGVMALCGTSAVDAVECGVMVAEINKKGGSVGVTIKPASGHGGYNGLASFADLVAATKKMGSGSVPLAFVRGANPAHTTPKANGSFATEFAKVPFKVSFSSMPDETSELCDLVLPDNHWLESWGDAVSTVGQLSMQQPTLDAVFDTKATADVLIDLAKKDATLAAKYSVADYRTWYISKFPGGSSAFAAALAKPAVSGAPLVATTSRALDVAPVTGVVGNGEYFVVVYPSPTLGAGRGANKPWLQELPDPVTKLAWQSWVEVHPQTFKKLGLKEGQHLTVETVGGKVTAPVYRYMGVRPDTVAVALGQGHTGYGRFAKNIGINGYDLVSGGIDAAGGAVLSGAKATLTVVDAVSQMVTTEGSARQHGRGIGQALTLAELVGGGEAEAHHNIAGMPSQEFLPGLKAPIAADAQGEYANPKGKGTGMYDPTHASGMEHRRWAMTIDLARCTGCSACVTACYSENNIPTVGAPYQGRALSPSTWDERPGANIIKGREMAWIRLERYYEGNENSENEFSADFDTRFVPMMCQHCGNAPCEPVCPVYATYHSPDGLNVQVYNRCVGTRYCSNNCPYKVRYFNWFGYGEPERRQYAWPEPMHWALNPDVTVRGKGVMEKCSFCVQRIRESEGRAKSEGREMKADEFTTACAQACPSRAIIFGDAADENWSVSKLAYDRRAYHVFEELNAFTAVVYLKKVTYPAPGIPGEGLRASRMASIAPPVREGIRGPNIASADVQLPAVRDYEQVDREIIATLGFTKKWFVGLSLAILAFLIGVSAWLYQIYWGLGQAGYEPPVMWGTYIITFVFWVGIGHAGTLISAILYLFRAGFRTSIYRAAEAMTVFAVMTAGLFPIIHIGRPWKFFWLVPYPNWRLLLPNFKSPLVWDVFAISTYLTISTTFLFIGLIPDIAAIRDKETNPTRKRILSILSLGWRNSDREWRHFAKAYLFLAAFSTPLVLSVHSVVSFDFAMALTPGWHASIFPPYFVAGAIFSGFAMVWTIAIPMRKWFKLEHYITLNHLDATAKVVLFTSMVVGCAYMIEFFVAWYSGVRAEQEFFWNRVFGQWWWAAWIMLLCNMALPMSLWSQKLRRNPTWLFVLSLFINLGMWFERFVIVVPSLSHEFEPWQWGGYRPSWIDMSILVGSFGWFFMWFLLFVKQLPIMAIAELKEIVVPRNKHVGDGGHH